MLVDDIIFLFICLFQRQMICGVSYQRHTDTVTTPSSLCNKYKNGICNIIRTVRYTLYGHNIAVKVT